MRVAVVALALLIIPLAAAAQNRVDFAPDITAPLGTGPSLVVTDHNLAHDNAVGAVTGYLIPAGTLPPNVQIEGYHPLANGNTLLALDVTTALPGLPVASPAEPRDVVEYNRATATFVTYFDGSAAGVPSNAHIDAVSLTAGGALQLSFDITVSLGGVGPVDDEDAVVYLGGGIFAMVYDGSAAGVPTALDLDALQAAPGALLVSFDISGTVPGVTFADEDVVSYAIGPGTYTMYFDGSVSDPVDWPDADLNALPEPARGLGLAAGAALLAGFGWRRARRRADQRERRWTKITPCPGSPPAVDLVRNWHRAELDSSPTARRREWTNEIKRLAARVPREPVFPAGGRPPMRPSRGLPAGARQDRAGAAISSA